MTHNASLIWFRQDLRLRDNPALNFASQSGDVLPIFIHDDVHSQNFETGEASRWWLHHSLEQLSHSIGEKLHFQKGDPLKIIPAVLKKTGIKQVCWNRCYQPWQIKRDKKLKQQLENAGISVHTFNASLLWEPWTVLKKDKTPYKVFTPYYRKGCLQLPMPRLPEQLPKNIQYRYEKECDKGLNSLALLDPTPWHKKLEKHWEPGEKQAAKALSQFLSSAVHLYKNNRDKPALNGTSRLSPRLHFGELSPHQVWHAALHQLDGNMEDAHLDCFLSELGWREFSYYLLFHYPSLCKKNFNPRFDAFPWKKNKKALLAWQQGQTGIPIIDAGMRELWQTGYMHNRVRMIVASLLVKNLLIHWHEGEAWFRDCLIDADLAANCASWQWVAGSGADAAPYFRIFNPVLQGKKFDSDGDYVRRFCPELSKLGNKYIHAPWEAPESELEKAEVKLGTNYPKPIINLKASRKSALDAFAQIK